MRKVFRTIALALLLMGCEKDVAPVIKQNQLVGKAYTGRYRKDLNLGSIHTRLVFLSNSKMAQEIRKKESLEVVAADTVLYIYDHPHIEILSGWESGRGEVFDRGIFIGNTIYTEEQQ